MMTLQVNKSYEAWRYCRALNPEEEGVWQVPRSCCIPNLVIFILIFYPSYSLPCFNFKPIVSFFPFFDYLFLFLSFPILLIFLSHLLLVFRLLLFLLLILLLLLFLLHLLTSFIIYSDSPALFVSRDLFS